VWVARFGRATSFLQLRETQNKGDGSLHEKAAPSRTAYSIGARAMGLSDESSERRRDRPDAVYTVLASAWNGGENQRTVAGGLPAELSEDE